MDQEHAPYAPGVRKGTQVTPGTNTTACGAEPQTVGWTCTRWKRISSRAEDIYVTSRVEIRVIGHASNAKIGMNEAMLWRYKP